jgi:1-acyl-sn-glycerol-3-phosphate acyltransferase
VILKAIAKCILKLSGWTAAGEVPDLEKAVFIAAPHTTNWDGFWLIVYKVALGVNIRFLAKHTVFWWPLGPLLRWFGAIPLDRSRSTSTVQQLIDVFDREGHLFLALAPEGTRKWKPYWKTGFYQIALAANVPIVFAYIDYPHRKMGIGPELLPSGDIDKDLAFIREFYEPFIGRHPALQSPIAFPPENGDTNARNGER